MTDIGEKPDQIEGRLAPGHLSGSDIITVPNRLRAIKGDRNVKPALRYFPIRLWIRPIFSRPRVRGDTERDP
jgi:hypothetical protein